MRPTLFRLQDLPQLFVVVVLGIGLPALAIASHMHAATWGEVLPFEGLFVVALVAAINILGMSAFYFARWRWLSKYKFTSAYGVAYFYASGLKPHSVEDVDASTKGLLAALEGHFQKTRQTTPSNIYIDGSSVLFVRGDADLPPKVFTRLGRKVYGITSGRFAEVGYAESLGQTAHGHELAHIYLNRYDGRFSEAESHELFKQAGI